LETKINNSNQQYLAHTGGLRQILFCMAWYI